MSRIDRRRSQGRGALVLAVLVPMLGFTLRDAPSAALFVVVAALTIAGWLLFIWRSGKSRENLPRDCLAATIPLDQLQGPLATFLGFQRFRLARYTAITTLTVVAGTLYVDDDLRWRSSWAGRHFHAGEFRITRPQVRSVVVSPGPNDRTDLTIHLMDGLQLEVHAFHAQDCAQVFAEAGFPVRPINSETH